MHERIRVPTPVHRVARLACDLVDYRGDNYALRPDGTQDWILTFTSVGAARYDFEGNSHKTISGEVFLIRPGVPHDYGVHPETGRWKNIWVHFVPRPEVLDWLAWPEVFPGHYHLQLTGETRREVWNSLVRMYEFHIGAAWRKLELAICALEHALLLCDGVNPKYTATQKDPRILRVADQICRNLQSPLDVEKLAREAGLSRSRFSDLFHQEMGVGPRDFVEQQRLLRAAELLKFSSLNVSQIADAVGFQSAFYFSLRYKKHFGLSPRLSRDSRVELDPVKRLA